MANEPDNLVPVQLPEIRATLAGRFTQFGERFAQMDKRFDQIEKRFDDFHALNSDTLTQLAQFGWAFRDFTRMLSESNHATSSARGSSGA